MPQPGDGITAATSGSGTAGGTFISDDAYAGPAAGDANSGATISFNQ
jgi:hypothetical protein